MSEALFVVALAGPPLVALAYGKPWTLVLPLATLPTFYLGLLGGWWGHGVGDGWEYAFALSAAIALAATLVAVALRLALPRR
jgi:hypothetical protein